MDKETIVEKIKDQNAMFLKMLDKDRNDLAGAYLNNVYQLFHQLRQIES